LRLRQRAGVVSITIHDDGGLERDDGSPALNDDRSDITLLALIERAELAGGHMRVAHRAGGGSLMQITIPGQIRSDVAAPDVDASDAWQINDHDASRNRDEGHRAGS
jgi:hypothetical protein